MTHNFIRRTALSAAGAFILAASPLHSASLDSTIAFAGEDHAILRAPAADSVAAPAMPAPHVLPQPEVSLAPGEFVWDPAAADRGEVEIVVSIPLQRVYVYRGDTLIGVSTVSTGREGHETPVGTFAILQKRREHYSNLYNNAPMPFMQRLTWDGIALHAGRIPGRPASHGCVRLPLDFARHLFEVTRTGAAVHIVDRSPSAGEALALVRGNALDQGMGGPLED